MNTTAIIEVRDVLGTNAEIEEGIQELARLQKLLVQMGVDRYCGLYPSIVRGLAYYTGIVFEVHAIGGELRAIGGGGRYDNLLADFGGPAIPATGFGIGDCVLGILLEEKGLLKPEKKELDYFVAYVMTEYKHRAVELAVKLRSKGFIADFSYKAGKLGKQLRLASDSRAKQCIIIGDEFKDNKLTIKDMETGQQELVDVDEFFSRLAPV